MKKTQHNVFQPAGNGHTKSTRSTRLLLELLQVLLLAIIFAAMMYWSLGTVSVGILSILGRSGHPARKTCVVPCTKGGDDAPAILKAFEECGHNGNVVFQNETYHVNSVMNTTGLCNCIIDLKGTLLWSKDIHYWLEHSLPVGYQNQSTAWYFGGENIKFQGHGYGTIDGNGQVWYDFIKGASNYPRRPHAISIRDTKDSVFEGLRFVQSQMWTMTIFRSQNVRLSDIYVRSKSNNGASTTNTDAADTIYSDKIHFDRWHVVNGDDGISPKANSTNILVTNSTFIDGSGIALGSIGQYDGVYEEIVNFTAKDIVARNTLHAAYLKTWTGEHAGNPPNGGGGGIGRIKNARFSNFHMINARGPPVSITQCISFRSGQAGDCNSSHFQIEDVHWENIHGTVQREPVSILQCSAGAPCKDIGIHDAELKLENDRKKSAGGYLCTAVERSTGFKCTGPTCGHGSMDGTC